MCVPVCSARSVVWTSIAVTAGSSEPSQVNSPISRCSAPSTVPSAAKKRTSAALTRRDRQPRVGAHTGRVGDLGVRERGAQAVERRDRVVREDGRRAAAERARVGGVRAEHRHPAQRARLERQQRPVVAGEHEARGGGAAQLGRDLVVGPRRRRVATSRRARRRARRAAAGARPCRRPPPRSRGRRGPRPPARRRTGRSGRASPGPSRPHPRRRCRARRPSRTSPARPSPTRPSGRRAAAATRSS